MQTLTPSVQEGAEIPEGAAAGETSAVAAEPLFSGPAPALWAGVGAFILIFIFVLMLIIRGRVIRAARPRIKRAAPNYFEPAGTGADIAFDDDNPPARAQDSGRREEERNEMESFIDRRAHDGRHGGDLMKRDEEAERHVEETAKKKKSAFAGLFAKKPEPQEEFSEEVLFEESIFPETEPTPREAPPRRAHSAPAYSANEARLAQAEDAAHQALKRADEAEKFARDLARANANTERTISLGLQENEAALSAMSERLTDLAREFQTRLDAAPARAADRHDAHDGLSEAHFAEFADLIGEQFESLRGAVNDAIDRLSRRIDRMPAAASHAVPPTAARVQLSDLLSDALPPQRYELSRKLSSGRTADACIGMPGRIAPIAVDARFPVEIFDTWLRARSETSTPQEEETALRRVVLRHIADAGEKLIVKGETADCAMMFIPSEHILTELHAHFPDLVQESYRAKVWMVAPTSLMATLHTISAVMAGAGFAKAHDANGASDAAVARELAALRERIAALEAVRTNSAHGTADEEEESAQGPSSPAASDLYHDLIENRPPPREVRPAQAEDKPPFPLR